MGSAQVNVIQIYNICIIKRWVSLGEKYLYDRYGQRSSYSSSLKLTVKSEILGTMFIISTGSLLSLWLRSSMTNTEKEILDIIWV